MKRNLKILILSLIFAFALWVYINLNLSYSLDLSVPVEIQSSTSQALSEEIPSSIDLTVKGKGWDLLNILISKNLIYTLDISKLKKDSKIITEQFINERLQLHPNLSVLKINPDTISISLDKVSEKYIPLKNNIIVNLKDGYSIIGKPILIPDSVKVQGASYLINRIKSIPLESKVFNKVSSNINGIINIKDTLSNLIKIDPKQINFSYNIQLSAEKNFDDINIDILNIPNDKEVLLIPPKVNLTLRGGVDHLAQIIQSDISVKVDFDKIESDTLGYIIPSVKIPEELNLLKMEPQKLQYIIKRKL